MATLTFLRKELVEHGFAIAGLAFAVTVALFITLARFQNQEFSISPLEVLSFSLYTFVPLSAFVLSNRLIVRDYRSRAQLYTESLPTRRIVPLTVKYLLGLFVVCGLTLATLLMAARYASVVDSITPDYFLLLALKTLSVAALYWAVMFAISLSGHLRLLLYVLLVGAIYYLLTSSSVDVTDFGPFAILMDGTLAYERVDVPVRALLETWALTTTFTLVGYLIALWQEGSIAEVLSRPMARRDYILAIFIVAAFGTVLSVLEREPLPDPFPIATRYKLDNGEDDVTIAYLDPGAKDSAEPLLTGLLADIETVQKTIGPIEFAPVYIVHDDELASWEFIAGSADGPVIYGNIVAAEHYDRVVFRTTALHQLLLGSSGGRSAFERYHWFLDGFTRRVTESTAAASTVSERSDSHEELLARALISLDVLGDKSDLIYDWQILADQVGYASAEALAYSALDFLESRSGSDVIDQLAERWLGTRYESDSRAVLRRWEKGAETEFTEITGLSWTDFTSDWRAWLRATESQPGVARRLNTVPFRAGAVHMVDSDVAGPLLLGSFAATREQLPRPDDFVYPSFSDETLDGRANESDSVDVDAGTDTDTGNENATNAISLVCILNYRRIGPFDTEMDSMFDNFVEEDCAAEPTVVHAFNIAGSGDRSYLTVELRTPGFHQPIRLKSGRITTP